MIFTKPDVILWDWDNTLINSRSVAKKALEKLGSETNITIQDKDVTEVIGGHLVNFWYRTYGGDPIPFVKKFIAYYREFSFEIKPFNETPEVLEWIQKQHIPQIVVSNKNQEIIDVEAERFGLRKYFDKIVGIIKQGYGKPSKEFADIVFGNVWPKNILMIGDGKSDMEFAKTIQAFSLFIHEDDEEVPFEFDLKLPNLNAVKTFLEEKIGA